MSLIVFLLLLALQGLIVGAFARLALPGKDPMTIPQTIVVGLAGTFIAGIRLRLSGGRVGAGLIAGSCSPLLIIYSSAAAAAAASWIRAIHTAAQR